MNNQERHWAMCDDKEVQEYGKQLKEGLIHPLEYARHIQLIAMTRYGIDPYTGEGAPNAH